MKPTEIQRVRECVRVTRLDLKNQLTALGCMDASKILGTSFGNVSRWASGKRKLSIEDTLDLLEGLNNE